MARAVAEIGRNRVGNFAHVVAEQCFELRQPFASGGGAWLAVGFIGAAQTAQVYSLFLAVMAAMAWTSNFPRYRVGTGALLFVVSDLLIFARLGPLENSVLPDWLVWPLYYFGQFLICTGVIQSLRHQDPRVAG